MQSTIHLRPVPRYDPPFDDELPPQTWSPLHQQLALSWPTPLPTPVPGSTSASLPQSSSGSTSELPVRSSPPAPPGATLVPPVESSAARNQSAQRSLPPGASGDARLAVRRFVRLCVEVLNGFRPAGHLRRFSLPSEAAEVVATGLQGARWVGQLRKAQMKGSTKRARPTPVAVLRVRLCEPRSGAIEAAVVLATGDRTWAMALRLELHQEAWVVTILRLI